MYCYPQYGVASSGYDGQMYGSQHYQYPSTYHQPQTTSTTKPAYKPKAGKSDPLPQKDASAAPAAYQQPGLVDASKANSNSTDGSTGLRKTTYPVKPSGRSASYQNHGDKAAYPSYGGHTQQKFSVGNSTSTASNPKTKVQSKNQNSLLLSHFWCAYCSSPESYFCVAFWSLFRCLHHRFSAIMSRYIFSIILSIAACCLILPIWFDTICESTYLDGL